MRNKAPPTCLQVNYRGSLIEEFSNMPYGMVGAGRAATNKRVCHTGLNFRQVPCLYHC